MVLIMEAIEILIQIGLLHSKAKFLMPMQMMDFSSFKIPISKDILECLLFLSTGILGYILLVLFMEIMVNIRDLILLSPLHRKDISV